MNIKDFSKRCVKEISEQGDDIDLYRSSRELHDNFSKHNYFHHFSWAGLPIIQAPQDIIQMQELIWSIQPDLIIETGVARGGSMMFYASLLELNAACGGAKDAMVLGIDIDIRKYNREIIEAHSLFKRITLIEGSSVSKEVIEQVVEVARNKEKVMVCLDSNHTHDHVLAELNAYAPLTTIDSYCVVFDTLIEEYPEENYLDRPWGPGNSPKTAVLEYLKLHSEFLINHDIDNKLVISAAPEGFLRRVK